jgi:hypothetical protein
MALSANTLKGLILTELESKGFKISGDHSRNADYAEAIATAVVNHIKESAVVNTNVTTSAGSGTGVGAIT